MKKIMLVIVLICFFTTTAWGFGYKGKTVVAQNNAPTTTKSNVFVPKNVPITPAMVKAAMSYTDAQSIRAKMEKMEKDIQGLKAADQNLWEKLFGKKKGVLVLLEGRLRSAIKAVNAKAETAISNSTAAQARAEEAFKKAEVADVKATEAKKETAGLEQTLEKGIKSIQGQVDTIRKIGQYALGVFALGMILLFILALRKPKS